MGKVSRLTPVQVSNNGLRQPERKRGYLRVLGADAVKALAHFIPTAAFSLAAHACFLSALYTKNLLIWCYGWIGGIGFLGLTIATFFPGFQRLWADYVESVSHRANHPQENEYKGLLDANHPYGVNKSLDQCLHHSLLEAEEDFCDTDYGR